MVDSGNIGGYRDKYRKAIEDQERLEKQFSFQLDALRKTLMHVMAAAQGQDKQLDASLINLKEKMRGASGAQVIEQMARVQKASLTFEHSRHLANQTTAKHLTAIADQLAELNLPTQLQNTLKTFTSGLKTRLKSGRMVPELLEELLKLQDLAITEAANPPSSFWQRLKGGKTLRSAEDEASLSASENREKPVQKDIDIIGDLEPESLANLDISVEAFDPKPRAGELLVGHRSMVFDPGDEDSYRQVAQRIAKTLEGLVERIQPNDIVRNKVEMVRLRIRRGMDWYVLAVTLEDIRDILMLRYLQNDKEFSEYLRHVNKELRSIGEVLGLVAQREEEAKVAADTFSTTVNEEVSRMRAQLEATEDLDHLKQGVSKNLSAIQHALETFKTDRPSGSASLTDQLTSLLTQVKSIESESEKTKELLEEERFRATHDALTELPNREAYNERAFQELQRYSRYRRPLALAVCDVDFFKKINDGFGHQAGDNVLKLIAKLIHTRLRKVDFVARYGGEEFVVLMPETPLPQAFTVLDEIRAVIAKTPFRLKDNPVNITISFGLAEFGAEDTVEDVFERADKALYRAKASGRNKCVIDGEADTDDAKTGA
ncbi:MAG: diguanylate cyclase [Lentisphaeria bacterium]|jgi:diguanylate cyclase